MKRNYIMQASMTSYEDKALWGFEEDLPSLACYAAIELDMLIQDQDKDENFNALEKLVDLISEFKSSINSGQEQNGPLAYLNPSTAVALNCAIGDSKLSVPKASIYDFMRDADSLIESFKELIKNARKMKEEQLDKIKELKSFCLHLSKYSLANEPPLYDLKPQHPYRR
jgi:hypothetical protein